MSSHMHFGKLVITGALCALGGCASTPSTEEPQLSVREGREVYATRFSDAQASIGEAFTQFDPATRETWPVLAQAISNARRLDAEYADTVKYSSRSFPEREALSAAVETAKRSAERQAYQAFANWPLDAPVQFEEAYPVQVRVEKSWAKERLNTISFDGKLDDVIARINPITVSLVRTAAIDFVVGRVAAGGFGQAPAAKIESAARVADAFRIDLVPLSFNVNTSVAAPDLSQKVLISPSAPGYVVNPVRGSAPNQGARGVLVSFASTSSPANADFTLVAEKQEGGCKFQSAEDVRSRRQIGLRKAPNPEIDRIQNEIANASERLINLQEMSYSVESRVAQNQVRLQDAINRAANAPKLDSSGLNRTGTAMANILNTYADSSAQSRINELQRDIRDGNKDLMDINRQTNETNADIQRLQLKLARTSSTIDVPDYAPYDYNVELHRCESKTHYKLIAADPKVFSKSTSVSENIFKLAHGIDPADPDRTQLAGKYNSERELSKFTSAYASPDLGALSSSLLVKLLPAGGSLTTASATSKVMAP